MIAGLAEHLWEKRLVAPLARVFDGIERHHVLEYKAREIPRRHHIRKLHQTAFGLQRHLSWRRCLVVAIKLAMVFVIALAYHQYDSRHTIAAAVYLDLIAGSLQLVYLRISQPVGIESEDQTIDGDIQICLVLFVQFVLHLSDGLAGKELSYCHLIAPCLRDGTI